MVLNASKVKVKKALKMLHANKNYTRLAKSFHAYFSPTLKNAWIKDHIFSHSLSLSFSDYCSKHCPKHVRSIDTCFHVHGIDFDILFKWHLTKSKIIKLEDQRRKTRVPK